MSVEERTPLAPVKGLRRLPEFCPRRTSIGESDPPTRRDLKAHRRLYELLSVVGVAEQPDRSFADWDAAMDANLADLIGTQDTSILGRWSYGEWADLGPDDIEPFAWFINGMTKYVATSTPLDRPWSNATAIDGDLVELVRDLKTKPGADIGVQGSISVAPALMAGGVVDALRLPSPRRRPAQVDASSTTCLRRAPQRLHHRVALGLVQAHYRLSEDDDT